jgi:hypothetical protein
MDMTEFLPPVVLVNAEKKNVSVLTDSEHYNVRIPNEHPSISSQQAGVGNKGMICSSL